ncbi:acid-sensing ion channel 4-B-like [Daphnia pulex]|uniref:acid-sensing ion channel 4-B-like n=1 Tax=Daphnia pulex TaxID=6669 RepID=UPI001EDE17F0|nr:acid-sensing ion channel 4-B-like [Daphnia pulex]
MTSIVYRKVCAHRNDHERYRHLVPGFGNYTEENCNFAVRQKRVTEYANCYMMNLPYKGDLPSCRPQQMLILDQLAKTKMNLNNEELDCVSECWKETYEFSASYADLELTTNFRFGNWSISPNQSNTLAAINFYYPSFMQTLMVNHYPTINQWFGILGGNLGLFLGASMVTVIELLVFCFSCCCSTK